MGLHSDLIAYLETNTAIKSAIVGGVFHEFYPQTQTEFPVLVAQMVSNVESEFDMDYPAGSKIYVSRYQLDIWGKTSGQVVDAAQIVDAELIAFNGIMGSTNVQRIERVSMSQLGEIKGDKQNRRVSADYSIWY